MIERTSVWHSGPVSALKKEEIAVHDGWLLVKSLHSMVSHGTERLVLTDRLDKSTATRMRIPYMQGEFRSTFTYGYSLIGEVIEGDADWVGITVHMMYPHSNFALVEPSSVFPIGRMDPKKATLLSNMETAQNALWDADYESGEGVAVVGFGLIGALVALLLRHLYGVQPHIFDIDSNRCDLAKKLGFDVRTEVPSDSFDLVFHTSATSSGLQSAIESLTTEGRVIELSWYGSKPVTLQLGGSFHYDRKRLIASQVSRIPGRLVGNWDFKKRKHLVHQLLGELDIELLLSHQINFRDSPSFFGELRKGKTNQITTLINY